VSAIGYVIAAVALAHRSPLVRRVAHAADAIGLCGIVAHPISEEAWKFYLALGFDRCHREPMMLVVTLSDVRAMLRRDLVPGK